MTLDVSKLSGWLNTDAFCRVERRVCDAGRGIRPGKREGVGWRRRKIGMHREGPTQGCGGHGTRGAHVEHGFHVRDLGRVEAERLVERLCVLPRRKGAMQCAASRGGLDCGLGAGLGEERT